VPDNELLANVLDKIVRGETAGRNLAGQLLSCRIAALDDLADCLSSMISRGRQFDRGIRADG
jgi:hypothetical protein